MEHDPPLLPVRVVRQVTEVLVTFCLQLFWPVRAAERIRSSRSLLAPALLLVAGHLVVLSAALPVSSRATIDHLPASVTDAFHPLLHWLTGVQVPLAYVAMSV